jgi:nucleotide-binding universal stress UspA family protein
VIGLARDRDDFSDATRRPDAADLILRAGRPVLAVPPGVEHFGFGRAIVAWKDCREARQALAAALPLLRLMAEVAVVEITDAAGPMDAEARLGRVTGWLAHHGISATPCLVSPQGDDGERLLRLAEKQGAELIVAGAYGYTRAREWALGGVTRTLLRHCASCLFLSH